MFRSMWLSLSVMLALLVFASSAAGEDGRNLPKLIPSFDGESGATGENAGSAVRRTAFQRVIDRIRPTGRPAQPKSPSTLGRLNSNTKRFFAKTKQVLTPWSDKKPKQAKPKSVTGNFMPFSRKAKSTSTRPSLFSSWFAKEQTKPKPSTVSEFLGQPKP